MNHILTEQELKQGCQLLEAWKEHDVPLEEVYDKSEILNKQGWYTVVNCTDYENDLFEIIVFGRAVKW